MKSNTHNIRKDNSCAVLSAIFEYKIREATSSILTESAARSQRKRLARVCPRRRKTCR